MNLSILNKGNEPTFVLRNRNKFIDLTLGTDKIGDLVTNWHVSDEISLSDHRYIGFKWATWKSPDSHITTPREPIGNPLGKT
jgi:hypothetical protein